ncbi:MAG: vitamin K epoxide reductase family protein [Microcoleaceae cyanobacterium MO_207.B10]|nr:vitamin K epoxide reductase family protein [Microcoleaceae cyanobacterium MO_207.B10]
MLGRNSTPRIHRWSRPIMVAIAIIGALETAYLTIVKLSGGTPACPNAGCEQVINSPYGQIFGLPITLFGFFAYTIMAILASLPLVVNPDKNKTLRLNLEKWTSLLMFILATAMVVSSSYLMYTMIFEIKHLCLYCIASATFSASLFIMTIIGNYWEDIGQLFLSGITVGMVTLIGILGIYGNVNAVTIPQTNFTITSHSGVAEIELARHLTAIGAKKYGAFWCPHCQEQKQLFGKEAFPEINYIECDPRGKNGQPELCQAANIKGYPTWEINGNFYSGLQSLEKLGDLSDYQGLRNFQNHLPRM